MLALVATVLQLAGVAEAALETREAWWGNDQDNSVYGTQYLN